MVIIITLGCRTNQAESDEIARNLREKRIPVSYKLPKVSKDFGDAGARGWIYIVNTCAVTGVAERKSRYEVARIVKFDKNAKIIVVGCATQNDASQFIERVGCENIVATFGADKSGVVELVLSLVGSKSIYSGNMSVGDTMGRGAVVSVGGGSDGDVSFSSGVDGFGYGGRGRVGYNSALCDVEHTSGGVLVIEKDDEINVESEGLDKRESDGEMDVLSGEKSGQVFIKVQDGCDNFCTFCIVPYLRGRSKCRSIKEIVEEIKSLKDAGVRDIKNGTGGKSGEPGEMGRGAVGRSVAGSEGVLVRRGIKDGAIALGRGLTVDSGGAGDDIYSVGGSLVENNVSVVASSLDGCEVEVDSGAGGRRDSGAGSLDALGGRVDSEKLFVITGINLSVYEDGDMELADLCAAVDKLGVPFRLSSLYSTVVSPEFVRILSGCRNFVPHFHLSLQSGSDKVLEKMGRRYTAVQFEGAVKLLRGAFGVKTLRSGSRDTAVALDDGFGGDGKRVGVGDGIVGGEKAVAGNKVRTGVGKFVGGNNGGLGSELAELRLSADVIVGFPGETDEDFEKTKSLIGRIGFDDLHVFPYSPRKGTVAATLPQVKQGVIKARANELKKWRDL